MFFGAQVIFDKLLLIEPFGNRTALGLWYPFSDFFRPYQTVTHMFMHSNFSHLFFNMFAIFMFGPHIERVWGQKKFLFFYLFAGFGAMITHLIVWYIEVTYFGASSNGLVWGASGAVFGLLLAFGMLFPNTLIYLYFAIPIKAKYFVAAYGLIELWLGLQNNAGDNVAHFAHLGGMLFGYLLIKYWRKNSQHFY